MAPVYCAGPGTSPWSGVISHEFHNRPAMKHPRGELIAKLTQQLTWLERSAAAYDAGDRDEALRMSVPLRVLLHDTNKSHSLLRQLNVKRTVRFCSTAALPNGERRVWCSLTNVQLRGRPVAVAYGPRLDQAPPRFAPFKTWWGEEIVYAVDPTVGRDLYRRDVVLLAAHKGGGAHVDPKVSASWEWLEQGAGGLITNLPADGPASTTLFADAHLAALRQITYEILHTPDLRRVR